MQFPHFSIVLYFPSAASGKLYTFGEEEGGKLGHGNGVMTSEPLQVDIPARVVWVACGGKHTAAVTGTCRAFCRVFCLFGLNCPANSSVLVEALNTGPPALIRTDAG